MQRPAEFRAIVEELFRLELKREVRPRIDKVFNLNQAAEAQTYLASREAMGKIIITP
jgi:NADPH:quinone reductase-like Zn-dependent oxidoreductase